MRLHFISRLALLIAGSFWSWQHRRVSGPAAHWKWMFIVGGALQRRRPAADAMLDSPEQRGLDLLTALVGAWMIVAVLALSRGDIKWWTFGSAAAIAGLSAIGLTIQ